MVKFQQDQLSNVPGMETEISLTNVKKLAQGGFGTNQFTGRHRWSLISKLQYPLVPPSKGTLSRDKQ